MKRLRVILGLVVLSLFALRATAQTPIVSTDVPTPGTMIYRTFVDPQNLTPNFSSGTTWDFSGVSTITRDSVLWYGPALTPYYNNPAYNPNFSNADVVTRYAGFYIPTGFNSIVPTQLYDKAYLDVQPSGLFCLGNAVDSFTSAPFNGVIGVVDSTTIGINPTAELIYPFPLGVGVNTSSSYKQQIFSTRFYKSSVSGNDTVDYVKVVRSFTKTITVDQSGTLITPARSYNEAIRVKIEFVENDTMFRRIFNGTYVQNIATQTLHQISYVWLVPGEWEVFTLHQDINGQNLSAYYKGSPLPFVNFARDSVAFAENAGIVSVNVNLSFANPNAATTVNYQTVDGTAVASQDYNAASGTLTFAPGQTTQAISLLLLNNTTPEPNRFFTIKLSGSSNLGLDSIMKVTILDDDRPQLRFSRRDTGVKENSGVVVIPMYLTFSSATPVVARIKSFNRTALASTGSNVGDYEPLDTVITFAPGQTSATISLTINQDVVTEATETLLLKIDSLSASAGLGFPDTMTVAIADDDINPVSFVTTGDTTHFEAINQIVFNVGLAVPNLQLSTVQFRTDTVGTLAPNTAQAVAGTDYVALNGTLTFNPNVTLQTITLVVLNDTLPDGDKQLTLKLSNPSSNISLGLFTRVLITITDNDPIITGVGNSLNKGLVAVYPNPSTNGIYNFTAQGHKIVAAQATDFLGRTVSVDLTTDGTTGQVSFGNAAAGMYILTLTTDNGKAVSQTVQIAR